MMNKHLSGFGLFSLIIAANLLAFQLFQKPLLFRTIPGGLPIYDSEFPAQPLFVSEQTGVALKIKSAVFNHPTKRLNLALLLIRSDKLSQEANFNLHFYTYQGNEMVFLGTQNERTTFSMDIENDTVIHSSIDCEWMADRKSNENIFVWVETTPKDRSENSVESRPIAPRLAVPVLFDYSMDEYNEERSPKGC
jgi:hypothetical protein